MNMQHKPKAFTVASDEEVALYLAHPKPLKAAHTNEIRISQIVMASRRIVSDYPSMAGWFCLQVKGNSERVVVGLLESVDIHSIAPMRRGDRIVKRHRIVKGPLIPALPGYVLVHCVPSAAAMAALQRFDKRVTGIVGGAETPYRIPLEYVEKFVQRALDGDYDYRPPAPIAYAVGEVVRVCDGPFASFCGVVLENDLSGDQIKVEVSIFGRSTPVTLMVDQIEKV